MIDQDKILYVINSPTSGVFLVGTHTMDSALEHKARLERDNPGVLFEITEQSQSYLQ